MTAKKKLTWGAGLIVLIIMIYSISQGIQNYETTILGHRQEIEDFMSSSGESPLTDSLKVEFNGLKYYPVDTDYKVSAKLELIAGDQTLSVGTSDGATKQYVKYAYAHFTISDLPQRVLLLQSQDDQGDDYLFLPFADRTNGEETYGGGRYLDIEFTKSKRMTIDFNLAYNPYCAYNASYSCPLPPSENRLSLAIRAGEQNY